MKSIKFGTGGFRGIIGDDFTKENVQRICQAICNISSQKKLKKEICIGYDNRFESEVFAKWCAEVFAGNRFKVEYFNNSCTTPVVMFASKENNNPYGVMITASHNPYMFNGVKVFVKNGKDASIDETNEIEKEFNKITNINTCEFNEQINKSIFIVSYIDKYINYLIKNQKLENSGKGLKVVYDAMFGSSVEELQKYSKGVGLNNFDIINGYRDAFFNFVPPAPNVNNIEKLKESVLLSKADIGFALDADGDRLAVVDEKGKFIDNNYLLAMIYYYKVKYLGEKGGIVKNCCTSTLCDTVAKNLGFKCYEVPVGFKFISSKLIETKSIVGGESSGGLAVENHIWGKDSLLTIGLIIKMLSDLKKPFSEILNEVLVFADNFKKSTYDKAYTYSSLQEMNIKNKVFENNNYPIINEDVEKIVKTDYLKIFYKNGDWVNIRFSGTEPILRIFVETESDEKSLKYFSTWENFLELKR